MEDGCVQHPLLGTDVASNSLVIFVYKVDRIRDELLFTAKQSKIKMLYFIKKEWEGCEGKDGKNC